MPAFPYERAAFQTAIAALFGNAYVVENYGTSINTLKGWSSRAKRDPKLAAMVEIDKAAIRREACRPLAVIHSAIAEAIVEVAPKLAARGSHLDGLALAELYQQVGNCRIALEILRR